jgi:hypothetical protein
VGGQEQAFLPTCTVWLLYFSSPKSSCVYTHGTVSSQFTGFVIVSHSLHLGSVYVRHARQCLERVLNSPRQKACRQCSKSKLGCDRKQPTCSRCISRSQICRYEGTRRNPRRHGARPDSSDIANQHNRIPSPSHSGAFTSGDGNLVTYPISPKALDSRLVRDSEQLLTQTINTHVGETLPLKYIHTFQEGQSYQAPQQLQDALSLLCRVFRTYPKLLAKAEQLPPFIHQVQISPGWLPEPLANCFALCRMWEAGDKGLVAGGLVESTIRREMDRLFREV